MTAGYHCVNDHANSDQILKRVGIVKNYQTCLPGDFSAILNTKEEKEYKYLYFHTISSIQWQ